VVEAVFVLMVRVDVAVPDTAGVTDVEEKSQTEFLGKPVQLKVVALANPLIEVTVTVVSAVLPAAAEALVGEREIERLGSPDQTVTATAEDVDDALSVSPP
jgi:hypothetical protein